MKKLLIIIMGLLLFLSCKENKDTIKLRVASEQVNCTGVMPQKCFLIKAGDDDEWTYLYEPIEGFNYEPGYEYVLRVKREMRENPAQDQSSYKYVLVKQEKKTKKESASMPHKS